MSFVATNATNATNAANASHAPTLLLTPHGHLLLAPEADAPALAADLQQSLTDAFALGGGHGLFYLGATQVASLLPPVLAWWRDHQQFRHLISFPNHSCLGVEPQAVL